MKDLYKALKLAKERGEPLAVVTIIDFHGSAPRGTGARMIVCKDGSTTGTVGGGAIEYDAQQEAQKLFETQASFIKEYILRPNEAADLGMVCGGNAALYFQYFSPGNPQTEKLIEELGRALEAGGDFWLLTCWEDPAVFEVMVTDQKAKEDGFGDEAFTEQSRLLQKNKTCIFSQPLRQNGRVYVFGGGHIAKELVPVLSRLDFRCVVIDDREAFANKEAFPEAEAVFVSDFKAIRTFLEIGPSDYVVIMTRGHQNDYLVEAQVLKTEARYIGVIGSRKKTQTINEKLMRFDGFTKEKLEAVYTPIGKAIKAKTPAEIAISIAAELIEVRASDISAT
ncbi:XdhC/CoxI family protein [Eubacterium sp. 1001713B170207_170306_E7]|uniref:XdhC family protein n=1 Tax=Eubacterium sp. 1001713B170207_170306_E7 TaxID=2787097 RepID=UPI0018987703|nr:XdhC/CoxI family protein [Eubacterium sp. 1001713B170207_170306_E7]